MAHDKGNNTKRIPKENSFEARLVIGIIVFVLLSLSLFGLGWVMISTPFTSWNNDKSVVNAVRDSLIMFFSGAIGSSLFNIRAYLKHACELKDVDSIWIVFYLFRPLLGAVLGLLFYFVLRGGFLLITMNESPVAFDNLNIWSLAALGGLIGLFAKNAINRMRELTDTLFGKKLEDTE